MAGLIPLLIALTIVETSARSSRSLADQRSVFVWLVLLLGLWWLSCETVARILAMRATRSESITHRLLTRWDLLAQVLGVGLFAWICYGLGWSHLAGYYTLALAPWALLQGLHWWCLALPVRAVTGVPWTRWSYVSHHVRFALMPLAVALPILDVSALIANHSLLKSTWLFTQHMDEVNLAGGLLLALALVGLLPWVLVRMWGAKPLPPGAARDELAAACQRAGVRVNAIMHWPTHGGRVYNAMVMGVIPKLRYVLFTDDLLRDFPHEERLAVLGHELGHARYLHLWIYLLFALATMLASWMVRAPLEQLLDLWLKRLPSSMHLNPELRSGLVALLLLGIQWRILFGWLSRVCERQADLAGAELAGDGNSQQGAIAMQAALNNVARFSGVDPNSPSWRHHSIAERVRFLVLTESNPGLIQHHHRLVQRTVIALIFITLGLIASAVLLPT